MERWLRGYFDKWSWLIEICKQYSIDPFICNQFGNFLEIITKLKKEGEPLDLALILKTDNLCLESSVVQVPSFKLNNYSKFSELKNSVNGHPLCYVIDKEGTVNIEQIPKTMLSSTSNSATLKNVSNVYKTITICLKNRVLEVYYSGKKIRINRDGFWMKPCNISFTNLIKDGFPNEILNSILNVCLQLSLSNKGSIVVLTKNDNPPYRTSLIKENFYPKKLSSISDEQLTNFLLMDGAAIINIKGELVDISQKLLAPFSDEFFVESGRGTKHNSSSMYSGVVDCVVFVVSHEGPITVYYKGKIYDRCFGELFGYS